MISTNERKLKNWLRDSPMELADFVQMSITLAEMVYLVHQQNAFSGGLSPSNIRIRSDAKLAKLTESVEFDAAYRSPEQTGRINRTPDGRSDLYALGVMFYEMLTGQMPFRPQGEEDWASVHISASPHPISELRPELEGPLQSIIVKLLSKSPVDRYQSAYGLLYDLKQCERMLEQNGDLISFEIGHIDKVRTFVIPNTLYGRNDEMNQLEAGLELAASGTATFRWITGHEGSGKTTLVHRFQSLIERSGGRFVEGECDFLQQSEPFGPILQALRQWINQIWSESAVTITTLKKRLSIVLGQESRTITALLPEVKTLLGNPSDVPSLLDTEVETRFGELLPDLIRCFADIKPPLVMFIDNLQWADVGTLEVLRTLALEEAVPGLMVIGAYRTETDQDSGKGNHEQLQVAHWLTTIRVQTTEHIALHSLLYEDVRQYISHIMHEDTARIRLLARSVYHQTGGNPHSLSLLLESWRRERKLSYDEKQHQWVWDAEVIRQLSDSKESHRLIEAGFARLPEETMRLLAIAAVIGPCFRLSILAEVSQCTLEDTLRLLHAAEVEGMICHEDEADPGNSGESIYMFLHDQVQRMVYRIYAERHAEWHLKLGRLLQRTHPEWDNDAMFVTIDHLNLGMAKMTNKEIGELAEHNLRAGMKALANAYFSEAKRYYETGLRLVAGEEIQSGSLIYRLMLVLAQCEYMCSNIEQAKALFLELKQQDRKLNRADRTGLLTHLIQINTFDENDMAVQFGREALAEFGWMLPIRVSKTTLIKEIMHTKMFMYRMRDKLYQVPPNDDEDYKTLAELVEALFFPLLMHNAELLMVLYARFIRYGLNKGINESLVRIIGVYELLLQRGLPSFVQNIPVTKLEVLQSTLLTETGLPYRISYIIGMSKQLENPAEASVYLENALRWGVERGDAIFSNLAVITCLITHNGDVNTLSELLTYMEDKPRRYADDKTLEIMQIANAYRAALQDEILLDSYVAIPIPQSEDQEQDNEDNYSYGCKLEVAYVLGKYQEALYWAKRGRENELGPDWVRIRKQRMYETLTLVAVYPGAFPEERKRIRRMVHKQLRLMDKRRGYLGANSSAYLLIQAEWKKISGDDSGAMQGYMDAVKVARTEKHGLIEGIICERLAIYYQEMGSQAGATISMMDASMAYSVWGVTAKVIQIRTEHADLLRYSSKQFGSGPFDLKIESQSKGLPLQKKVEESETSVMEEELLHQIVNWSSKLDDANLLERFLANTLRQAGADRGFVIRYEDEIYHIEAQTGSTLQSEGFGLYAEGVLRHVLMTGEPVVLGDAIQSYYMKDPYIQYQRPRSIICMRMVMLGSEFPYLLYLENTHVSDVFIERTVNVLELMITRMTYFKMLEDSTAAAEESVQSVAVGTVMQMLIEPLTNREVEILTAVAEGLSNKEIAARFGIAEPTVKTHVSNIYGKLGVKRRGQAVARARELQLLPK
ncbi:AAA family ATPase [Paenibacillus sp. FA6]|uniref:AAA family ATPase n=1 Tax=Paenibacillus sp. FA6 TaxID=3413029 RepID=UPI003F65DD1C